MADRPIIEREEGSHLTNDGLAAMQAVFDHELAEQAKDIAAVEEAMSTDQPTPLSAEDRRGLANPPCGRCGGPHQFDTSVPSDLWNSVIRAAGLSEYLCTTCIVLAFVRAGVSFEAELYGEVVGPLVPTISVQIGSRPISDSYGDLAKQLREALATLDAARQGVGADDTALQAFREYRRLVGKTIHDLGGYKGLADDLGPLGDRIENSLRFAVRQPVAKESVVVVEGEGQLSGLGADAEYQWSLGTHLDALLDELVMAGWPGEFDARERAALAKLGYVRGVA